mmetsp:Transcript_70483/g.139712  ORF Transcript_70483/g.139712 Transcript_70483/m.139712 type:complete len:203 (+) Transcript_70483:213-821(+)
MARYPSPHRHTARLRPPLRRRSRLLTLLDDRSLDHFLVPLLASDARHCWVRWTTSASLQLLVHWLDLCVETCDRFRFSLARRQSVPALRRCSHHRHRGRRAPRAAKGLQDHHCQGGPQDATGRIASLVGGRRHNESAPLACRGQWRAALLAPGMHACSTRWFRWHAHMQHAADTPDDASAAVASVAGVVAVEIENISPARSP